MRQANGTARTPDRAFPGPGVWPAVPPQVADVMRPELGRAAEEVIEAIQREVPEYARPHDDTYTSTVRRAVHQAVQQFVLQIADCTNLINLEFSLETAQLRENSLFKVNTLLGALHSFRDALAAEVELAAQRDR